MTDLTQDVRVVGFEKLESPQAVQDSVPLSDKARATVLRGRTDLRSALAGDDSRMVVIAGPCSIHDPKSALEYAERLATLRDELADRYIIIMRVYFEKPRTTVGWKGFIYDPDRDGTNNMGRGLIEGRRILLAINELGLPCATEFLDPIVPQYMADLVSWAAIGARTTESQTHRQMASGLSMPVGFKNATDGSLQVAIDAMQSASQPHAFLGIDGNGQTSVVRTTGNPDVHMVLRGGGGKSNYSRADIAYVNVLLEEAESPNRPILVDCSHANSNKDYRKQTEVFDGVLTQVTAPNPALLGVMLESHLVEGKQSLGPELIYGQSVTDGCISWDETERLLRHGYAQLDG